MNWDLKYGELAKDEDFVNKCENLKDNLKDLQEVMDKLLPLKEPQRYEKLTMPEKIDLDLLLVFTLNSLQWVNLRVQGIDPNNHPIKGELERIKATMLKWQQVKDKDKRPTVNIEAAKRFVRSGLYDPNSVAPPLNKKKRFSDNDE